RGRLSISGVIRVAEHGRRIAAGDALRADVLERGGKRSVYLPVAIDRRRRQYQRRHRGALPQFQVHVEIPILEYAITARERAGPGRGVEAVRQGVIVLAGAAREPHEAYLRRPRGAGEAAPEFLGLVEHAAAAVAG